MALNLLFNGTTAVGVTVVAGGFEYNIMANKEVIISAGPFQSPQLLMVSGIGPKETLGQFNIPVVKDLPGVGQNMWDSKFNRLSLSKDTTC
jgi:choline dehydrogenase